ncbi:E3 SUMO-protein ligase ZBED1-like [Erpetoichthys calabaricus]|uniref:E3 SUMO-protein ligase ZBED1-like n=1 Tax=Erpetoichthys calabaricus TaxID=27687 RepID=UPI0022343DFF|nr:E3 SUMO-protein ligase ZBED1-like [Erpetoichthys calabaricus]
MVPLSTVEKDGFRAMINTLDPRYVIPSRKYFSQTAIPDLYREHRGKLQAEVATVPDYSTTADVWSSRTMEPYLSLTIHFINDDWLLKSYCLQTSYFPNDHTGELLAAGLLEALNSWGLAEQRQVAITMDKTGVKDERIQRAVGVCKKIVSAFSYSWKKRRDLGIAQDELGLPKHMLTTETPTRWGTCQKMIQRVLEQERAISQVLKAERKLRHLVLSWQDVDVLEAVNKVLSPLQDFTDALSREHYVSVSYLKPVLHLFNTSILAEEENDTQLTEDVKKNILAYLNEKYSDPALDDLMDVTSLLDPRFRTTYIKNEKVEHIISRAEEKIKLLKDQHEASTGMSALSTASGAAAEPVPPPEEKRKKSFSSFFKKQRMGSMGSSSVRLSDEESIKMELRTYLQTTEVDSDADPLEWWKCHQANFPRVAKLARRYLCIPATSSPSERAYSTGGNIVTCHRAVLKPDAVDRLVFLAQNL